MPTFICLGYWEDLKREYIIIAELATISLSKPLSAQYSPLISWICRIAGGVGSSPFPHQEGISYLDHSLIILLIVVLEYEIAMG